MEERPYLGNGTKFDTVTLVYSDPHRNLEFIKIQDGANGDTVNFSLISLNRRCSLIKLTPLEKKLVSHFGLQIKIPPFVHMLDDEKK